jgi:N-acetylglucosamine kinase-like BadF-type ATPase
MAIFIGVDGGGTKTRLMIQENEGALRYVEFDATIRFLENGYEAAATKFVELLRSIDGLEIGEIKSIAIGLAGAGLESEQRRYEQAIKSLLPGLVTVQVQSDSTLSLDASFPQSPGVIVIAGTGSVAIGRADEGSIVRVGGWGRLLGDEGSGHALGLDVLKHYTRVIDGRDKGGSLYAMIEAVLRNRLQADPREIRSAVARSELTPSEFAKLAFDATADPKAQEILTNAANGIAELIRTCARSISYQGRVACVGSVIQNVEMMKLVGDIISHDALQLEILPADAPVRHALDIARGIIR